LLFGAGGGGGFGKNASGGGGSGSGSAHSSTNKVKVPKPIVLPSMRKEHNGYDPKLSLINKGNNKSGGTSTKEDKDGEDIVSKLRQNGGGWGQQAASSSSSSAAAAASVANNGASSSGGNDGNDAAGHGNFVKIVEVKPIQSTSQWGTNVIVGGSVGGDKNRDGGESVVRVHEHDPSLLGKTNVVSRREEKVTRREFPSLRDSLDPNNNTTYRSETSNNIADDADHHWKFEMSSDDRGRYEDGNTTMPRSPKRDTSNGRSHNRDHNNGRRHAEDTSAFLKQNSSIGNVTIMKRNDNDATTKDRDNNNNNNDNNNKSENNDRGGGYVDEARLKFEDEIDRVARELEAKKLSSKSSTWAGKSTPMTATSNIANPLRMLVGNSKQQQQQQQQQQQAVMVAAAAEIAAAPTSTGIVAPPVRREHLTTQQLIEIQLHQQQEQQKRLEHMQHQQRAHVKQHQLQQGGIGGEMLKTRKKRGGRRVREAEERRLLKQTLGATTTTTTQGMAPGVAVKVLSKDPSSVVNSENVLRQKPSSSLSTSHRLLRRQQQFEQQQKLTEKLEKDILEASIDNEEETVNNNKRSESDDNDDGVMHRSASGAYLSGKIEPLRIASPVLSVDNAFGSVWSSSKNTTANDNSESGVAVAAQSINDDPLFGLDSLDEATATTTTIGGGIGWSDATANVGSHTGWLGGQHQQHSMYGHRPRSVPATSMAHHDVASALPDDLDDEFGSSDSLYDAYNTNNGEEWDDYNNYLYAQQQQAGGAAAKSSRFNQVLDAPSFVPGGGYSNAAYGSGYSHQTSPLSIEQQYQMYMQSVAQSGSQTYYDMDQYIEVQRDYEEQFGMSDMDFLYHAMQEQAALASATQAGGMQQAQQQQHRHGQRQSSRGGRGSLYAQSGGEGGGSANKYNKATGGRGAPHPRNKTGGQITSRERRRLQRLLTGISKVADPNAVYPSTTSATSAAVAATTNATHPSTEDATALSAKSSVDAPQILAAAGTAPPKRGSRGSRGGRRGGKKSSSSPGVA